MKKICRFILKITRWKVVGDTDIPDKCVICVAPHTSNWDFPLGLITYTAMGKHASFLMKKDWFFFPMSVLFKAIGGIPVDRSKKTSLTDQIVEIYNSRESFQLAITPEGTRKHNPEWKKGFYYIALAAKVPIAIIAFDYKNKTIYFKNIFVPTGDADGDLAEIKSFYKGVTAKHPKNFAL